MQKKLNSTLFRRWLRSGGGEWEERRHFNNIPSKPSDERRDCHENLNLCLADLRNFIMYKMGMQTGMEKSLLSFPEGGFFKSKPWTAK